MTQKKRIASKLFLLVLVMTLISCCFLGSTFARYTSGASGTGTLTVAEWDIDFNKAAGTDTSLNVTFDTLSPLQAGYTGTVRTHSTGRVKVAEISNEGVVDALVTLTAGSEPTLACGVAYGTGVTTGNGAPTEAECKEVFKIKWYTNTTDDKASAGEYTAAVDLDAGKALYVYAEVIWTSDVDDLTGDKADIRDTWMGENVTGASWTLNCTAVQNSEKP